MQEEKLLARIPKDERFLLIKQWGFGFWSDMDDVSGKLLLAEITDRQPVIYWGKDSLFAVDSQPNSFEQYFLPVSNYSIGDVVHANYTYYPPIWNYANLLKTDPTRFSRAYRDLPSIINSNANVIVGDVHNFVSDLIPWINEAHPAFGLSADEIHSYIANKYIKLQPDILQEIDEFYHTHMQTGPLLAVHVRGGSKFYEDPLWKGINIRYPQEIDRYLIDNSAARIFLLTDDEAVLEQYKQLYGNILIYTDCTRKTSNDIELCTKVFADQRRKGVEVIKDSYLASKCDHFIGNGRSNVTQAIKRLKAWRNDQITILI